MREREKQEKARGGRRNREIAVSTCGRSGTEFGRSGMWREEGASGGRGEYRTINVRRCQRERLIGEGEEKVDSGRWQRVEFLCR